MSTCPPVGVYKVHFRFLERPYGEERQEEYNLLVDVHGSTGAPYVGNKHMFVGPLCQHQLDWLKTLPGIVYNLSYRFTVEEVSHGV